uniref:Uncharacterized protein n=1 Tax=Grammatophora oceanica TaxID=210454 RepID=A0A7S1VJD8_9STRA|mmetsp:Transcript_48118/g.71722  ORF Transcript_48118/g.71722 Transcript_48118/m.71722 type:complete len:138 (+) Transcript_48118:479-892(+)
MSFKTIENENLENATTSSSHTLSVLELRRRTARKILRFLRLFSLGGGPIMQYKDPVGRLVRVSKALEFQLWIRSEGQLDLYIEGGDATLPLRIRDIMTELKEQNKNNITTRKRKATSEHQQAKRTRSSPTNPVPVQG